VANELILVVEDNEKSRKLVRDVLTFKGYEVIDAETGEEGVRLAQKRRPNLILMDIRLPGSMGSRRSASFEPSRQLGRFPCWP
jgi:CheY-like chemotaxis protein